MPTVNEINREEWQAIRDQHATLAALLEQEKQAAKELSDLRHNIRQTRKALEKTIAELGSPSLFRDEK